MASLSQRGDCHPSIAQLGSDSSRAYEIVRSMGNYFLMTSLSSADDHEISTSDIRSGAMCLRAIKDNSIPFLVLWSRDLDFRLSGDDDLLGVHVLANKSR